MTVLIVLTALLIYIISPFNFLHTKAFANEGGSTIGSVNVGDLKGDALTNAVSEAVRTYQSEYLVVTGSGVSAEIDLSSLQYDVNATISEYERLTEKPWYAFWEKKKVVNLPIQLASNDIISEQIASIPQWDAEQTYANVMLIASYLRSHEVEAVVNPIANLDEERLAVAIAPVPPTSTDIQTVVDVLNDRIFAPNEQFSYLNDLSSVLGSLNRETINFVASLLYEVTLNLDVQLVERHAHLELPAYIQPGLDAFVSYAQEKDFKFINTKDQPVQLKVTREGVNLKMEYYAAQPDETAAVRVVLDQEVEPRTITRYTYDLAYGRTQQILQGSNGKRVTVYSTNYVTGEEKVISRDYYPPTNTIVLQSARPAPANAGGSVDPDDPNYNPNNPGGIDPNNPDDGTNGGLNPDGGSNSGGSTNGGSNGNGDIDNNGNPIKYDKAGNIIN